MNLVVEIVGQALFLKHKICIVDHILVFFVHRPAQPSAVGEDARPMHGGGVVGYRWVGVMGGGTEHGAYETHVLMRNPTFEDVCRAHPIAAMWCSHFTFPFWSWGLSLFPSFHRPDLLSNVSLVLFCWALHRCICWRCWLERRSNQPW